MLYWFYFDYNNVCIGTHLQKPIYASSVKYIISGRAPKREDYVGMTQDQIKELVNQYEGVVKYLVSRLSIITGNSEDIIFTSIGWNNYVE